VEFDCIKVDEDDEDESFALVLLEILEVLKKVITCYFKGFSLELNDTLTL